MRVRVLAGVLWVVMVATVLEVGSRTFWHVHFHVPFFDTRGDVRGFYPELTKILAANPRRGDRIVDVLLLGGSTLSRDFGSVPQALQERISTATGRPVRIFDLGIAAQTSRDSVLKYRALAPVRFDLVIVYDGFNEVRANNVPPGLFRDDYSHYSWYEVIADVTDRRRLWPFAAPYTAVYVYREIRDGIGKKIGHPAHVPKGKPGPSWTAYGGDIRTPEVFRRNLTEIVDTAKRRADPVVLLTFAAYFAPRYSDAAFRKHALDYATHQMPIEIWGRPEYVAAALQRHNAVVREVHDAHADVGFVDLDTVIPREAAYFNDVCHLTVLGSETFAEAVLPASLAALGEEHRASADAAAARASP